MPHLWNNNTWVVSPAEIMPWYNNLGNLQKHIDRNKDNNYGIKKVCSGGNGRELLISYDSLPSEIKNVIGDPRRPSHLMDYFYTTDAEAVRFFNNHKIDGVNLSAPLQEEYIINASVLRACITLKEARERERKTKGISCKGVMRTICSDAESFNASLFSKYQVRHTLPVSDKRFKMAFNDFLKPIEKFAYNYPSLISGKVRNQNSRKVTDPVIKLLNDLFAGQTHKPSRTEITRQYEGFLSGYVEVVKMDGSGEVYDPKEFRKLSDATIINYLGSWSESIGTYSKRSGDRQKLMQKFKPYHSLEKPQYAGSIISVDDRQPPFEHANGERVWFYNAIDLGSEAFTCWVWGKSKEGIIVEFYRQLVRNYAEWGLQIPLEIEAESSLNSSFTDTFLKEGAMFHHVRIEGNNARGKRIERYNADLRYGSEKQRKGWLARPFALNEANQAGPGKKVITPYAEIIENSLRDIEDWNNTAHSEYPDKTRWEVFLEKQAPNILPTNWRGFLQYLGYTTQTSVHVGIIRLQESEFLLGDDGEVFTGERLINLMHILEGETVTIHWLDDNKGRVLKALVYLKDTCICEAVPKPKYNRATAERTPKDNAAREIMSAYVATIDGYMREKKNSIEEVLVIDNRPKTLNRKFVIPDLNRYEANTEETETLPEILNETDELELIPSHTSTSSFIRNTKDRI